MFGVSYRLANGIDLRDVTTTRDLDADIDTGELVDTKEKDGLVELGPENLWGEQLEGGAVHLDEALALDDARDRFNKKNAKISNKSSIQSREQQLTRGILLLAKNLGCLYCRHFVVLGKNSFPSRLDVTGLNFAAVEICVWRGNLRWG
jgi:hypothetical protein